MKKETKIAIFLLLLSPLLGEVLSGSTPLFEFLNPISFLILVLLYGGGTLLIREIRALWQVQWSVIFLAVAYGIAEEGTMIQSFFNTAHADLGALSGYGIFLGVMWPWAIMLTIFHSTISTLIPIAITDLIWPECKNRPLLNRKGLKIVFIGFIGAVLFWIIATILGKEDYYKSYIMNLLLVILSTLVIGILIWLGYKYRNSRIIKHKNALLSPFVFGIAGFFFQAVNLILPNFLSQNHVSAKITLTAQFIQIIIGLLFVSYQLCHKKITEEHISSLIFGSILFFILIAVILGFYNFSMLFVGISFLILLIYWKFAVARTKIQRDPI